MRKLNSLLSLTLFWLLCCCTAQKHTPDDGKVSDYPTNETFELIDPSMSFMKSDPSKAERK